MRSPFVNLFASTSVVALSIVSAFAPAMAEESFTPAHRYPKAVVSEFMNVCKSQEQILDPQITQQICYCLIQAMQDKYSLEQIIEIERVKKATGFEPPEGKEIGTGCAVAVLKANSPR